MSSSTYSPPKLADLFDNFDSLIDSLVPLGILLAVLMVILGGYKWMSSAGDPEKIKQAQATLTWAIIGLVLLLLVGLLIQGLVDYIVGM
ncbi:pilin [bacterium]|nr:pilin [bacterium]